MQLEFKEKNLPATENEIQKFEKEIGYKLPQDYKNFLLKQNGCWIARECRNYDQSSGNIVIRYKDFYDDNPIENSKKTLCHKVVFEDGEILYALLVKFESTDSVYILNEKEEQESNPSKIWGNYGVQLVIGDDTDGNSTTMSLNDDDYGTIYIMDGHGDFDETYKNTAKISNSFEEFYNSFEFYDITQ